MVGHPDIATQRPDIVLILADDLGFSDIGCYGGEIETPELDRLAASGVRMTQFYNTARCSPSRASLLTGLHPHQSGVGVLTEDQRPHGYPGTLGEDCLTIAEVLRGEGFGTYLSGKWHLTATGHQYEPDGSWPTQRGFDEFFGTIVGAGSYWTPASLVHNTTPIDHADLAEDWFYTDAISDAASEFVHRHVEGRPRDPFLLYVSYTAPHWPLHAKPEAIERYKGRYDVGWDELRRTRIDRLVAEGILPQESELSPRDPSVPAWDDVADKEWQARRMEVYAAQVSTMDAGIGRIVRTLEQLGRLESTIIMFLSDNGGATEELPTGHTDETGPRPAWSLRTRDGRRIRGGNVPDVVPGPEDTWTSYGRAWSNLSNTPFREHKRWTHEGGIATPFIVHWPIGLRPPQGVVRHSPHQLPDVMATLLDITGITHPSLSGACDESSRYRPLPPEGLSMLPSWQGETDALTSEHTLYWEHEGNAAVRRGRWKLVRKYPDEWELYDIVSDRAELHDRAREKPDIASSLLEAHRAWAGRCGVLPRERLLSL